MVNKFQTGGVWASKTGELPALFLSQKDDVIIYLQTDVFEATVSEFRGLFRHDPQGLTVPTAKLLYEWGRGHLASDQFFRALSHFIPVDQPVKETTTVATTPKKAAAAKPKAAAKTTKPAAAAKGNAKAPEKEQKTPEAVNDGLGRQNTVAGFMKRAIMDGKLSDTEILDAAAKQFGFNRDEKKTYVGFYRRQLKQKGFNPPEMKKAA